MYQALYRKQRPKDFREIVGQDHIVRTLKNQIQNERVSHAYLFCGTRGTGKTSCSLVFSKAINCLSPIDNEPCNECDSCLQINNGNSMDVFEIDAASNNGVDNIRDIKDEINYPPTVSKYKIYIIDEVHMLSTGAFNALLKTLEEPPSHAIFILATTDPQKLPQTILSRCQRYDFKRIKAFDMKASLLEVCKKEGREIEENAIDYICLLSDGAMRDALSLLDQAFSYFFDEKITLQNVLEIVGSVDKKVFFEFTDSLIEFNSVKVIEIINNLIMNSSDITQFVTEEIKHLRDLLVAKSNALDSLSYSESTINLLIDQSQRIESMQLIFFIEEYSKLLSELKFTKNQRILFETGSLKLCNALIYDDNQDALMHKIKKLEDMVMKLESNPVSAQPIATIQKEEPKEEIKVNITKAIPSDILKVKENWSAIISKMDMPTQSFFKTNVKIGYVDNGESDILYLVCSSNAEFFRKRSESLDKILKEMYQKEYNMKFIEISEYDQMHLNKYGAKGEYKQQNGLIQQIENSGVNIVEEDF